MDFVKMEGLGNDFVVVVGPTTVSGDQVTRWCDRRRGIGADGVLEVTPLDRTRIGMRYWNADGAPAEMCGNGLRCVALLAHERHWVDGKSFVVETAVGERPVEVSTSGRVRGFLGEPQRFRTEQLVVADEVVYPVALGNPHAVLFVEDPGEADVEGLGSRIGTDPIFPGGTNVEFALAVDRGRLQVRTWERGVGETPACGTGAAAAAFVAHLQDRSNSEVIVELRGGELSVELRTDGAWMEGPARLVFDGTID